MHKASFEIILARIRPQLASQDFKVTNLTPETKLSIFLMFLRSNGYHSMVASHHIHQVSTSTATKVINLVSNLIASLMPEVNDFILIKHTI